MVASLNKRATRIKDAATTKIELFDLSDATFVAKRTARGDLRSLSLARK
jgi:hypothetical protein